jgi:hypothetical protein
MKKWSFVALLLVGATILGSTVLREPIARAAQSLDATIVGPLDGQGNVKVHEQGTANVQEQNLDRLGDIKVHEQGRVSTRSDNDEVSITKKMDCSGNFYTVPTGRKLVIEYISAVSLVENAQAYGRLIHVGGNGTDVFLPVVFQPQAFGTQSSSEAVHYVVGPSSTLEWDGFNANSVCSLSFFVSLGGYLQ